MIAAPMAGVSDVPFRQQCLIHGASLAVGEMVSASPTTRDTHKSLWRTTSQSSGLQIIQIVGHDPAEMARAAAFNQSLGADIIDINMGCPAKKVCKKASGSALLADEETVSKILTAVTRAVSVPVTLKIRTGTSPSNRNAVRIARIAEDSGIQALTIHGRTRECAFKGAVEYDTIAEVAQATKLPIIANGDITCPKSAMKVLNYTGADGVMIGRAAQGKPWLLGHIRHFWQTGIELLEPSLHQQLVSAIEHITEIHQFYGAFMGPRFARKHVGWYFESMQLDRIFRSQFNALQTANEQLDFLNELTLSLKAKVA